MLLGLITIAVIGCAALGLTWWASFFLGQATGRGGKALAVTGGLLTTGLVAFAAYAAAIIWIVLNCGCTS
jgi:hypothetical protein